MNTVIAFLTILAWFALASCLVAAVALLAPGRNDPRFVMKWLALSAASVAWLLARYLS